MMILMNNFQLVGKMEKKHCYALEYKNKDGCILCYYYQNIGMLCNRRDYMLSC